ncbi:hypothetical protein E2C01_042568 [Portunus trituberculatus]|uniref:Uncharacterized protein n=1 Tax=Portunus trituberculatus TaxID=210409 RepID=A0A5B7FTY6_PORTR|nr:hypothetical protein [Portunus trituberculatus]
MKRGRRQSGGLTYLYCVCLRWSRRKLAADDAPCGCEGWRGVSVQEDKEAAALQSAARDKVRSERQVTARWYILVQHMGAGRHTWAAQAFPPLPARPTPPTERPTPHTYTQTYRRGRKVLGG